MVPTDPQQAQSDSFAGTSKADALPRRRRWYQFRLRTLLLLVTLAAVSAGAWRIYVEPYRQQRRTMKEIERLGGRYVSAAANPWLRGLLGSDLQNLTMVDVGGCDDPASYLGLVADLPAMETLAVGGPAFTDEHLAQLHRMATLRSLVLDGTNVTEEGLAALRAKIPDVDVYRSQRRAIEALKSKRVNVDAEPNESHIELRQLLGDAYFSEASFVNFGGHRGDANRDLIHVKGLTSLRLLNVGGCPLTDAALENLEGLTRLESLSVSYTRVNGSGFVHLSRLSNLEALSLESTHVGDDGVAHLKAFIRLQSLDLSLTRVSDAALLHLGVLSHLQDLELEDTHVSDAGLVHLKGLSKLRRLVLTNTQVTDAGLAHLDGLSGVQWLLLKGTKVTRAGADRFRRAHPDCSVQIGSSRSLPPPFPFGL